MGRAMALHTLDLIIPVYNEADVLPTLFEGLKKHFSSDALHAHGISSVRFIFVDDGSHDDSAVILTQAIGGGLPGVLVCLSRNFGHQAALSAGFDFATADRVGVIDADLQDPPELILSMADRLSQGFDVVYGERQGRKESVFKKLSYWLFYRLLNLVSDLRIPLDAGDFCVMTGEVVSALRRLPEKQRFHRGLRTWVGFRQTAYPYERPARQSGSTKYSWRKLYQLATDGVANLSVRPLRLAQAAAFGSAIIVFLLTVAVIVSYFDRVWTDRFLIGILAVLVLVAFTSALQLLCLYVLGAYVSRMYLEIKSRPSYIVARTVGVSSEVSRP